MDDADVVARRDEAAIAANPEARGLLVALGRPVPAAARARAEAALPARPRLVWLPATLAAAAAAIFIWALWPASGGPAYTIEGPFGGLKTTRAEAITTTFGPESALRLVLRPAGAPAEAARAFAEGPGGVQPVDATITRGEGGTFRVEARGSALFRGPAGPRTLHLVLGPADRLATLAQPAEDAGLRWIRVPLTWQPEGRP
ncbi:MAG: hypothetical protein R3F43_05460 [bacterium]